MYSNSINKKFNSVTYMKNKHLQIGVSVSLSARCVPTGNLPWRGLPLLLHPLSLAFLCLFLLVYLGLVPPTQQYLLLQSPLMFTDQAQQDVIMVLKFPSNSPVTHVAANTQPGLGTPAVITVTANRLFAVNKWHSLPGK